MGGNSEGIGNITTCAEFNFHADPETAFVVKNDLNSQSVVYTSYHLLRGGCFLGLVGPIQNGWSKTKTQETSTSELMISCVSLLLIVFYYTQNMLTEGNHNFS